MNLVVFTRFALAEYAEQARKEEPTIEGVALLRKCIDLARGEIISDSFYDNISTEAPKLVHNICCVSDYDYWCQLGSWTPEEAASLAMGFDPRGIAMIRYADAGTYGRFEDLRRVAERYLDAGKDCAPAALCRHMRRFTSDFPEEILSALRKDKRYLMKFERRYKNLKKTSREMSRHRDSYLKIIYALAVDGLKYSKGGKTGAVSKIRDDLDHLDMRLTEKPIRAMLDLAVDRYKFLKNK
ncbi:hypothetical protein V5F44_21165 [Xanthobacter sp. V2C-8]|uniref:hypothetical protein n=1 Tax=Xanthobacter albus TaxID=3119929 RepID=UPI00372AAA0F